MCGGSASQGLLAAAGDDDEEEAVISVERRGPVRPAVHMQVPLVLAAGQVASKPTLALPLHGGRVLRGGDQSGTKSKYRLLAVKSDAVHTYVHVICITEMMRDNVKWRPSSPAAAGSQ